jgi:hypothetical protein
VDEVAVLEELQQRDQNATRQGPEDDAEHGGGSVAMGVGTAVEKATAPCVDLLTFIRKRQQ